MWCCSVVIHVSGTVCSCAQCAHRLTVDHNSRYKDLTLTVMVLAVFVMIITYTYQKTKSTKQLNMLQQQLDTLRGLQEEWSNMDDR
jgi:heme/copper-type cytochrome/quinol oxidase subunit 3